MTGFRQLVIVAAACSTLFGQSAQVKQGIDLYNDEQYLKAATAFEAAVREDPKSDVLYLYVGTAYSREFHEHPDRPGSATAAQKASAAFRRALELTPDDLTSLASLGSLAFNQVRLLDSADPRRTAGLNEAKTLFQKVLTLAPRDPFVMGYLAALDAEQADCIRKEVYDKAGLSSYYNDHPIGNAKVRAELKSRVEPLYDEALELFRRALSIQPQFPDAIASISNLTSRKADLVPTAAEYKRQTAGSDAMVDKALSMMRSGVRGTPEPSFNRIKISLALDAPFLVPPPPPPPPGK